MNKNVAFNKWNIQIAGKHLAEPVIIAVVSKSESAQELVTNLINELIESVEKQPDDLYGLLKQQDENEKDLVLCQLEISRLNKELQNKSNKSNK